MSIFSKLFRSAKIPFDFSGMTDCHSHILPGVDDGVEKLEDSLSILGEYEREGVKKVWLTPHVMEDMPNSVSGLRERFELLRSNYSGGIELKLASENMIDNLFAERLDADDFLPIGDDGRKLLVETSYFSAPMNLRDVMERIMKAGYYPLLAHPERYNYMTSISEYTRLKEMGVMFQLNAMSLSGYYGPMIKDKAERMLNLGYYNHIGSDLHRIGHLEVMRSMKMKPDIAEKVAELCLCGC